MRGKCDTVLKGVSWRIVAAQEGWPLVRVALYRGTTVLYILIYTDIH